MKGLLRNLVLWLLKRMARRRLKKFHGKVIAVTGSVGKTTAKDAIFTVLNSQFRVKRSPKSMNSEFGLPLTILEVESGYSSAIRWSWLLVRAWLHSFAKEHSEVLLLELGVDKPGDMSAHVSLVKPDIAVFLGVEPVHLEEGQFGSVHEIFDEKRVLVDSLGKHGIAVLNVDNEYVGLLAKKRGKRGTVTFGAQNTADFQARQVAQGADGLSFVLNYDHHRYPVQVPVLGTYNVYNILPAIVCGLQMGMHLEAILVSLERFALPPGRLNLIPGIQDSLIIDSSYNASPTSMREALRVLGEFGGVSGGGKRRRVAVLGNMNELGEASETLHMEIGEVAKECADLLITVGKEAKLIGEQAIEAGMPADRVFSVMYPKEAADLFRDQIAMGDVILVKGSQNRVRLERFVKEIMAHPSEAKDVLVRQEKEWHEKL